ncbi:TPA: metal-dependent hydrolase [Campylobacter coli]|uniref:metal-dependent hydrolase n=1 Tax=Helicobacter pullorum TaxID=35818 RepID=UPI000816A278|nr:metal-dependent hydrolase [Helicobacter pullorum]HEH5010701.1 metal-dependent hydrolase [Campylobacter coli]OCR08935.1 hypothetical protein A7X13_06420 [Helicobacter pullorum]HEH5040757.1 metal-dependent hydrolase [Campylobacter coli]HEH5151785.1 metal-dependent hydrolase [Campylobacter coli]HEH5389582.1 metal-dependent hydrolase [Campylobacter coli]
MLAKTHSTFALAIASCGVYCSYKALGFEIPNVSLVAFYGAVYFGSLFPDIDEPNSKIGRRFVGVSNLLNAVFGHRGFTHSLAFIVLLGIVTGFLLTLDSVHSYLASMKVESLNAPFYVFWGFIFGNILHLLGDSMTKSGIPLLMPFSQKKFFALPKSMRFVTGKSVDLGIAFLSLFFFVLFNALLLNGY